MTHPHPHRHNARATRELQSEGVANGHPNPDGRDLASKGASANQYVITNSSGDYWSNETGWGSFAGCTKFDSKQVNLPLEGMWEPSHVS